MINNQEFLYKEEAFKVLLTEKNSVLFPEIQKLLPEECSIWDNCIGTYQVEDYILELISLKVPYKIGYPMVHDMAPVKFVGEQDADYMEYGNLAEPLSYSGGIILAKEFVKDYGNEEEYPCYCYKKVLELIFENGTLVTSIDHSKDMVRIRKNIEKGFRNIHNRKDARCIRRFIRTSFVQNYSKSIIRKKWKQIRNILVR